MAEDVSAHLAGFETVLENRQPFFIVSEERDRYAMHGWDLHYASPLPLIGMGGAGMR
jgi:hypothetical protein